MVNLVNLVNFSSGSLSVGDWTYSAVPLTAPSYLPLNNDTASYLASSYPTLSANFITPVTAYSAATASLTIGNPCRIASGNGIFIAITTTNKQFYVSRDNGETWSIHKELLSGATPNNANYSQPLDVFFGNGIFVIVCTNCIYTSQDAIVWTPYINTFGILIPRGAYGNGVYLIGASDGSMVFSPDGVTWTKTAANYLTYINPTGIAYGNGAFVAGNANANGFWTISLDNGLSWSATGAVSTAPMTSIAFGNGTFCAVAGNTGALGYNIAMTSPNGVTWTTRTLPSTQYWRSITFGNGVFLAVGQPVSGGSGTAAATSPDGITWTARVLPASAQWSAVAFGGPANLSRFVALADGSTSSAYISFAVAQTNFTLPVVPALKGNTPYIKAT